MNGQTKSQQNDRSYGQNNGRNKGMFSGHRRSLRRSMALFIVTTMVSSQSFGQVLSVSNPIVNAVSPEATVETIRLAQTSSSWPGEIDIDPPVIDHEALESGVSSEPQAFNAIVVDDRGLERVLLFYRNRSGAQYESVEMQSLEDSNEFTASVDTSLGQSRVEYYIEALDTGGNRVLKGFPFFPLVRELAPQTANVPTERESSAPESKMIYVLLGVAAVGLALALSGSSDDGGGGGVIDPDPEPGTVPLNIEVTPP